MNEEKEDNSQLEQPIHALVSIITELILLDIAKKGNGPGKTFENKPL